jgi:DNA-binding transcriptional LysR family regulator
MDWDKIRIFYCVAKVKSFSRAAEMLRLTQPTLSRTVQDLEDRLKQKLFFRHSRGLMLTRQGEICFRQANKMLVNAQQIKNLMQEEQETLEGKLTITMPHKLLALWFMPYVPGFLKKYPQLELAIIGRDEAPDLNLAGADIALTPYLSERPDLSQRFLQRLHFKLYASLEYLARHGAPLSVYDLQHHPLLAYAESPQASYEDSNWHLHLGKVAEKRHTPYLQVNSAQGLLEAAKAGLGIVSCAEEVLRLRQLRLVPILPEMQAPSVDIYYAYPKELKGLRKIKALTGYLLETLSNQQKAGDEGLEG